MPRCAQLFTLGSTLLPTRTPGAEAPTALHPGNPAGAGGSAGEKNLIGGPPEQTTQPQAHTAFPARAMRADRTNAPRHGK